MPRWYWRWRSPASVRPAPRMPPRNRWPPSTCFRKAGSVRHGDRTRRLGCRKQGQPGLSVRDHRQGRRTGSGVRWRRPGFAARRPGCSARRSAIIRLRRRRSRAARNPGPGSHDARGSLRGRFRPVDRRRARVVGGLRFLGLHASHGDRRAGRATRRTPRLAFAGRQPHHPWLHQRLARVLPAGRQSHVRTRRVFYILPDKASIAETFPEFAQSRAAAQRKGGKRAQRDRH